MTWMDLSAGDPAFYTDLFGWTLGADGVFTRGDRAVAGYGAPLPPGSPPGWTVHLPAPDPAGTVGRVRAAGGRVEPAPADRPVVVADPAGARFAVRAPDRPAGPCWAELCTPDVAAARAFYAGVFGWDPRTVPMALPAGEVTYTVFCRDGEEMAGLMPLGGPFPPAGPARWLAYVEVPDCAAAARSAADAGGAVPVPPLDIPRIGRVAILAGRTGETFAVIELPPSA